MIQLKGMTWDHSRGYDPMIATSEFFSKKYNNTVQINWDKRSLQAFADRPIDLMADEYDLMVIDYPHVGEVSALNVISNISRVPIRIVADNTRMLPAQIIFADITLKILRRRQSTCTGNHID